MSGFQLVWGITGRMIGWGLGLGALLGAVYGLLVTVLGTTYNQFAVATVALGFGLITGGLVGALLGAVDGLVMSLLTLIAFRPMRDRRNYRLIMAFTSVCPILAVVAVWALSAEGGLARQLDYIGSWIYFLLPALIAACAAWYAAWRVAEWVMDEWVGSPLTKDEERTE